jgi:hypothetical protein
MNLLEGKRVLPLKEGKREGNVVKKLFRDQLKISAYDLRFTPYNQGITLCSMSAYRRQALCTMQYVGYGLKSAPQNN